MATFQPADVRRILLISSTALGDTVLSTAAIAAVRRRFPQTRLTGLIHRDYADLFRCLPELDAVVPYEGGYRRFLATVLALRAERPDLALILHGNEPQATPLGYLSGARHIFKLPNANRFRFLLTNSDPVVDWSAFRHGFQQRLAVAALAGAEVADARMRLPTGPASRDEVARFLAGQGIAGETTLVGLQPGASSGSRMWPAQRFVDLGHVLLKRHPGLRFVVTGSPAEGTLCRGIATAIGPPAIVAAGNLGLQALPALLQRLALLVSGDTGTMHAAVAVDTPVVALFAVSDPRSSGPAYDLARHVVIHRPCKDLRTNSKSDDPDCIGRISHAEVAAAVENVLARGR